ncbi:MAG: thiamine phosphate synthase [Solirubrobacteraceae bacterium]
MSLLETRRARLRAARLYIVCPAGFGPHLEAALRGGVDVVQLRDKDLGDDELLAAAASFGAACRAHDALFIINDRPDLALAAKADGVHVGQDDVPVPRAREIAGEERLVGLSTHTPAQVDAAHVADYIGVGPVHATPTKPGRPAVGLELVAHAAAHVPVPFFAIGGITHANLAAVTGAGATRVAVVRAITEAEDPESAARELRAGVERRVPAGAGARDGAT